jgi:elongation factor 1-gamma
VIELPAFISVVGNLKVCEKATTPQITDPVKKAAEEAAKKAAPKKEEQKKKPKEDDGEDEDKPVTKAKNPLDLLPPSTFDLYNFKTLYVNHPDKRGEGIEELKKQYDPNGFSIWFLHYEMYKGEGKELYKTENMANGFLQRFDDFRKYAFGRLLVLGTEEAQEIMGVFLWRGTGMP